MLQKSTSQTLRFIGKCLLKLINYILRHNHRWWGGFKIFLSTWSEPQDRKSLRNTDANNYSVMKSTGPGNLADSLVRPKKRKNNLTLELSTWCSRFTEIRSTRIRKVKRINETECEDVDYRIHLGQEGQVAGSCEHGNKASGSITGTECLDQLRNYQIFKDIILEYLYKYSSE
jgi:hypothetical protein